MSATGVATQLTLKAPDTDIALHTDKHTKHPFTPDPRAQSKMFLREGEVH